MSEPIKPGDLVMVVHPKPCGCLSPVGATFVVQETWVQSTEGWCNTCRAVNSQPGALIAAGSVGIGPASRLRKIDPPAQPEHVETREELHA